MMPSSRNVSFIAVGLALFVSGCKGCGDGASEPAPGAAAEPERSELEQLEHRIGSLKIDLKKSYPKRADGVVDCGSDADCFVVMAHRCEPAVLDLTARDPAIVATQKVRALYRITGADGDTCTLVRRVLERDMELPPNAREALLKQGKTDAEVDAMRADANKALADRVPERMICPLPRARTLGLALSLATKDAVERHFRAPCQVAAEGDAWPADLAAPPAPAAPAAPAAQ